MLEESSLKVIMRTCITTKITSWKNIGLCVTVYQKHFPLSTTAVPLILFVIRFMHCFQQCNFCDTYAVYPYFSIKEESLVQVDGAHVSRSFNLSPARNPFDRPEGGEQQWRQGKNAFDKWSHVQLRFFMKWFLLWYTYALLLGENLLAKMAFQNIVVVSERPR